MIESNAAVACTSSLLVMLIDGRIALPEVEIHKESWQQPVQEPEPDHEAIQMQAKLSRASRMLKKRREREH